MFRSRNKAKAASRDTAAQVDVQTLASRYVAGRHVVELRIEPAPDQIPPNEPETLATEGLGTRIAALFADLDEPAFDDLPPRSGTIRAAEFPE